MVFSNFSCSVSRETSPRGDAEATPDKRMLQSLLAKPVPSLSGDSRHNGACRGGTALLHGSRAGRSGPVALTRSVAVLLALSGIAFGQAKPKKKPDKEPPTQTLPLLPDPPAVSIGETSRLVFHVSHLSAKGLLSPQTQEAIKELMQASRGGRIVMLRAFVAGTGDARRVQTLVSEMFSEKKLPLPALTTVQVGALPLDGAQVVIESVSEEKDKKPMNPAGVAFLRAQHGASFGDAISTLENVAKGFGITGGSMLRVTCYLGAGVDGSVDASEAVRVFPAAAIDLVERLREGAGTGADCEGIARRSEALGDTVQLRPDAALVNTSKLLFSGAQMAFRNTDAELRLAFERLRKSLTAAGTGYQDAVFAHFYPLSHSVEQKLPDFETEFFGRPIPATVLTFEGLPSLDASLAMDLVAAVRN